MLTGVLPTEHGLRHDQKKFPSVPYLPEMLAQKGYETIGIVSSLLLTPTFGFDEGFDRYHALVDVSAASLVDTAIREMALPDGRSRFLFLHLFDAHWPYQPPPDLLTRFGPRPKDISDLLNKVIDRRPPSGPEEIEGLKNLYDAEIFAADRELGRLFQALKEAGRYDSALIIVTADHGEGFYEHGFWQHSEVIYSEVTRVPLIVKWPGNSRRDARAGWSISSISFQPSSRPPRSRLRMRERRLRPRRRWRRRPRSPGRAARPKGQR